MPRAWLICPLLILYLLNLGTVGFLGPDEPRYASIGREMAQSHDVITPRLNGTPWFEKPPLLYWSTALGRLFGFSDEWAARLPVALMSLAFLWFFFGTLEREFSARVAFASTAILGTSVGWLAYSFAAVTDLPMTAALGAAMLIALFDTRIDTFHQRGINPGYWAGGLLGLAILAKAFLPLILFAPLFLIARRKRLAMIVGCIVIAAPWYLLVWLRNGSAFWQELFWKQQVMRYFTPVLEHVQPWWFYIPVIVAGLFPWIPLAGLLLRGKTYDDVRVRSLILWMAYALIFLSAGKNKLPGYVLPLLPPLAIVLGVALEKSGEAMKWWLVTCSLTLIALPGLARSLPSLLLYGVRRGTLMFQPGTVWIVAIAAVAIAAWWLAWKNSSTIAIATAALGMIVGVGVLKGRTFQELDARVSARTFWRSHSQEIQNACYGDELRRDWQYQLNYYAARAIPMCDPDPTAPGRPNLRVSNRDGVLEVVKQ